MKNFEDTLHDDIVNFLVGRGKVDSHLPECPDVEQKWEKIAQSYIPDGAKEYQNYPVASLGWMMYIGMAIAKFWDEDWQYYSNVLDLYNYIKVKRGYDCLDEYICEEVLQLNGEEKSTTESIVNECAARAHSAILHSAVEPGTYDAFNIYVDSLHQLYLAGMYVQLRSMGYRMKKI